MQFIGLYVSNIYDNVEKGILHILKKQLKPNQTFDEEHLYGKHTNKHTSIYVSSWVEG